mgnify:CR=1 FL=1
MEANLGDRFVWWTGVVESRQDPKKVGRCRVRILGSHTHDKALVPTADLPWAYVMVPLNDYASLQVKEGDVVVGFYLDGQDQQVPVVMGILPGIPVALGPPSVGFTDPRTDGEVSGAPRFPGHSPTRYPARLNEPTFSRLARNEKIEDTIVAEKKLGVELVVPTAGGGMWSEPQTPYGTVYPYNRVMETESGHVLEFDDTPGAERVHIYHRSGTFIEMHPSGDMVTKIKDNAYEIVLTDKNIYVKGKLNITSLDDINISTPKNVTIEAGQEIKLTAGTNITTLAGAKQSHTGGAGVDIVGVPINLN